VLGPLTVRTAEADYAGLSLASPLVSPAATSAAASTSPRLEKQ